jgi:hypothetical protein
MCAHTERQHGDLIGLLYVFPLRKESRLKMNIAVYLMEITWQKR